LADPVTEKLIGKKQDNERKKSAQEPLEDSSRKKGIFIKKLLRLRVSSYLNLVFPGEKRKFYGI
jgi:hypothetical protein